MQIVVPHGVTGGQTISVCFPVTQPPAVINGTTVVTGSPVQGRPFGQTAVASHNEAPGMYTVTHDATEVTIDLSTISPTIKTLSAGTEIYVSEVRAMVSEKRVRGRTQDPTGWISLLNTETGFRWASQAANPVSSAIPMAIPVKANVAAPVQATVVGQSVVSPLGHGQSSEWPARGSVRSNEVNNDVVARAVVQAVHARPKSVVRAKDTE